MGDSSVHRHKDGDMYKFLFLVLFFCLYNAANDNSVAFKQEQISQRPFEMQEVSFGAVVVYLVQPP